ncbi:MAG: helix-turn-helix transcriptional regulator [Acidobacteriota bacterium]|nr:helix-turn-helix transcriptional regulator [Acidobacteriota bacterium]
MPAQPKTIEIQNLPRECHQALILAVLAGGPTQGFHGYRLALELEQKSGGAFRFNHGTLYPILHKLEQDGQIAGDWLDEPGKRKRKRYSLTEAGRRRLAEQATAWLGFFDRFFAVIGEVGR